MKFLIIRLVITVSLPIIIGVALVLVIFYQNLMDALNSWERDSLTWIKQTQKQILYNSLLSQEMMYEYSFNQMQIHLILMNKLIDKYNNQQILVSKKSQFTVCSYRELTTKQCPHNVYEQMSKNLLYVDLYFVRSVFQFNLMTPQQQDFILMNDFLSFYARAAYLNSQKQDLLLITSIYNSDTTSVLTNIPSNYFNMSKSNYEYCLGNNYTEPFDPRCRQWYIFSKQNEGYFFYEPYSDAFERTLTMTLSSQINKSGQFQSVNSIDFNMNMIIDYISKYKSANQYSVLFHEFNNTLFYHHLLTNNQITSWEDLEFQNIAYGSQAGQQIDAYKNEKQKFNIKLQQTLDFIKTGNYSMYEQANIDQLYQKWSKLGVKYISMVCPIKSHVKKYNTQQPYSYSIILAAKVMQDQSNDLKLFNIMNINTIKIPLIVESVIVCLAIFLFIANYGYFQILQVQRPIEILIKFLKKSLQQQHQCQIQIHTKKNEKFNISNIQKMMLRKRNTTTNLNNNFSKFKNEEQVNTLLSPVHNESPSQATFNNLQFFNQYNQLDRKLEQNRTIQLFSKVNLNSKANIEDNTQVECLDSFVLKSKKQRHHSQQNFRSNQTSFKCSNQQLFNIELNNQCTNTQKNNSSFRSFKNQPESNLSNRFTSQSQITQDQKEKSKDESKEKILQGLKPLFLEMQIIKEAFQNLERLINYQIDASNQNQQGQMNNLLHFANAKNTFQCLNNQNGLSRCYFNLGVIYILRNEFSFASQYLESSVWLSMALLGIDSLFKIKEKYAIQQDTEQEEWLQIFSKRIFSLAYSQKQVAFQIIYQEKEDYLIQNNSLKNFQHKLTPPDQMQQIKSFLKKSLDAFKAIQNLFNYRSKSYSEIFQIYIYQEIVEIFMHLDHKNYCKQIQNYIHIIARLLSKINRQKFKFVQRPVSLNDYKLSDESHLIIHEEDVEYLSNSNTNQNDTQTVSQEIANKMIDVINNRQKLILGYLELTRENYYQAIEYLTQTFEEGKFYSSLLRKKTIFYLNFLFEKVSFKQDFIDELILKLDDSVKIDLTLLLQMGSFQHNFSFDCCLQNFVKSNFFRPYDKIQVIIFDEKLEEFLPFTLIQSQHHFISIINSIQSYSKQLIQNYKKNTCTQLNWQSALTQSLESIQKMNYQQIIDLNKARQKIDGKYNQDTSQIKLQQFQEELKIKRLNMSKQNKKVIILFSKKQNIKEQLVIKKNIFQIQKPVVYHMIDSYCVQEEDFKIQSNLFSYEPFISEAQLMIRLKTLREEEINIYQKEFLSILNHF
ncbi:hypothetical protein ABPG74_018084 [Tetrahymena malaccensis]